MGLGCRQETLADMLRWTFCKLDQNPRDRLDEMTVGKEERARGNVGCRSGQLYVVDSVVESPMSFVPEQLPAPLLGYTQGVWVTYAEDAVTSGA